MRQRDLNFFRRLLESRKQEILTEAERALGTMNNKPEEACPDPTDRASLESDRTFELRMRDRERKLLAKINETLLTMDKAGEINQLWDKWLGPNTEFKMVRTDKVVPLKDLRFTPMP